MASKRLIKELDAYNREPSPAVVSLEPVGDDDLFQLKAVLRGPDETAYEGTEDQAVSWRTRLTHKSRWTVRPHRLSTFELPCFPTRRPIQDSLLSSERQFQDRRNLSRLVKRVLDADLWTHQYVGGCTAIVERRRRAG